MIFTYILKRREYMLWFEYWLVFSFNKRRTWCVFDIFYCENKKS